MAFLFPQMRSHAQEAVPSKHHPSTSPCLLADCKHHESQWHVQSKANFFEPHTQGPFSSAMILLGIEPPPML